MLAGGCPRQQITGRARPDLHAARLAAVHRARDSRSSGRVMDTLTVTTPPSVRGFHVQVRLEDTVEYPLGRLDLGLGRLQDGVPGWCWQGREGPAEVAVVGIFGGNHQAL